MKCRHCHHELQFTFLDLGSSPPSNAYLSKDELAKPEIWYPLRLLVCEHCWLVQTEDFAGRDALFNSEYAYFSSFSSSWLQHAKAYVDAVLARYSLNSSSMVIEIASNDGYLLQYVKSAGIPCLGIEPTSSTAVAAMAKGLKVIERFFGVGLAKELVSSGCQADLMVANNVLAHVPDVNDFVSGFSALLKPNGVVTFEFPHLLQLVDNGQFDTVYHEHFSYLSLTSVTAIFQSNGLSVFDVEELGTHGGSLRVHAQRADTGLSQIGSAVDRMLTKENLAGMTLLTFYQGFQSKPEAISRALLSFLVQQARNGVSVAAYGAAAKGNTLLNYAGIRGFLLPYVVDRNPAKQDKFMPGSRIPIVDEEMLRRTKPAYVLILPWNLKQEVMAQLAYIRDWGGKFVTAIPELELV